MLRGVHAAPETVMLEAREQADVSPVHRAERARLSLRAVGEFLSLRYLGQKMPISPS